ncbi:EVE domain-containing protein [Algoriphagus hitonicola]|uniref:Predicted RNA-binding protein, contains PUA-like domain n=1 Tax=Algoriphagus hitonicola TaxID=435880 RepID=A0A1I2XNX8_9BACT|nr:EVE domain-containing protein [Algoriphagus hitonicola]SFH15208.1 Predicted RNA-binding protein, contains PUA-like domain [Algoriphagus hitonicola]
MNRRYWMVKSEPSSYSWEDFESKGMDVWDGVRNYQARNYLREMKLKDQVLFYHSGKEKAVVGLAEVVAEAYPEPKAEDWVSVDLKAVRKLDSPVSLQAIKAEEGLSELPILKQSRLSVLPLSKEEFELLIKMTQ